MGANAKTIQVTLKTVADVSDVTSNVQQIQKVINQLKLPENLKSNFTKIFSEVEKSADKASQALASGLKTKGDVSAFTKNMDRINTLMVQLQSNMSKISPDILKNSLDIDTTKLEAAKKAITDIQQQLTQKIDASSLQKVEQAAANLSKVSNAKSIQNFVNNFKSGNFDEAEKALRKLEQGLSKVTDPSKLNIYKTAVDAMRNALTQLASNGDIQNLQIQLNAAQQALQDLGQTELNDLLASFQQLVANVLPKAIQETNNYVNDTNKAKVAQQQLNSELDQFKSRITYFFGMNNAVNLFQRAIHSAYETVKDLDAVMTETAVVTDFSVGDMWSQLPEYTQRANELGVSIHGAYEAATIYYQQGLKTNEVVAVSNETLKMARIAGLDAATATDRMTNALRGFNMEINETNAQRINDVYSKLAAITASDTDEISTAMTKVASLANNANMEFETTAAFLAQIVETTRESAETAGTALKTVVARFSEVKELYNKGNLLGTDEEGQEIDVNKVSTALRSAGINLNEYLTGAKGLDDIFLELASKWDSLDQVQQRYIATMAAGSRQQSRFIAMMSDYDRTLELTNAAYNANGSSQRQYEKTLESLETKLTQLKNAWDTFLMGLADDQAIKFVVDALTGLATAINNITSKLPGLAGSLSKVVLVFTGFKVADALFKKFWADIGKIMNGEAAKTGTKTGNTLIDSFKNSVQKNGGGVKGLGKILFGEKIQVPIEIDENSKNEMFSELRAQFMDGKLSQDQVNEIQTIYETKGYEEAEKKAQEYGTTLDNVSNKIKGFEEKTAVSLQKVGMGFMAVGSALSLLGSKLDDGTESGKKAAAFWTSAGTLFMGIGTTITTLGTIFNVFGIKVTVAGFKAMSAGIKAQLGWGPFIILALAIIGVIALLVAAFVNMAKNSPEAKLEAASEAADKAAESAQRAADAYNNLKDSLNDLDDKYAALENMTRGTEEWYNAVRELNAEVLNLMDTYNNLGNVSMDANGILYFDDTSAAIKAYQVRASNAQANQIGAKIQESKAQTEGQSILWKVDLEVEKAIAKALVEDFSDLNKEQKDIVEATAGDQKRMIAALADSFGVIAAVTNESVDALTEFGNRLIEITAQQKAYYTALSANALDRVGLSDNKYAQTYLSSDRMENRLTQAQADVNELTKSDLESDTGDYERYWKDIYGNNVSSTKGRITGTDRAGNVIDISAESAKAQYAAAKAANAAADETEAFAKGIQKADDSLKNLYSSKEGKSLNKKDLDKLTGDRKGLESLIAKNSDQTSEEIVSEIQTTYGNKIQEAYKSIFGKAPDIDSEEFKQFSQDYAESLYYSVEGYKNATKVINDTLQVGNTELTNELTNGLNQLIEKFGLSSSAATGLANGLSQIAIQGGDAQGVLNAIMGILSDSGLRGENKNIAANILSSIDWSDSDAVQNAITQLEDLGATIDDDLTTQLISLSKTVKKVNLENLENQLINLDKSIKAIKDGDASFSKEDYDLMAASGVDRDNFVRTGIDEYIYIGSTTNDLLTELNTITSKILAEVGTNLEEQIVAGEKIEDYFGKNGEKGSWNGDKHYTNQEMVESIINGAVGVGSYDPNAGQTDYITRDSAIAIATQLGVENPQQYSNNGLIAAIKYLYDTYFVPLEGNRQKQETLEEDQADIEIASSTSYQEAAAKGGTEEQLQGYVSSEAQKLGIDSNELQEYTNKIIENNAALENNKSLAMEIAKDNILMNEGLTELANGWEDISKALQSEHENTPEYSQALASLKSSMQKVLGISTNLDTEFYTNAKNMELMARAANGDVEAIEELRSAAAKEIIAEAKLNLDNDSINEIYSALDNFTSEEYKINTTIGLDDSAALDTLYNTMAKAGMTAEQIQSSFDAIGWEPELDTETYTVSDINETEGWAEVITDYGPPLQKTKVPLSSSTKVGGELTIPRIVGEDSNGFATYTQKMTATYHGKANDTVSPHSSPRGGGSSKKEKSEKWDNPYDELYNLTEKVNEALRTREKLERQYDRILNKRTATAKEFRQNSLDQIAQLKHEIDLQNQLLTGRRKQLQNLGSETYTDDDGNEKTYTQMGVTKYASYDEKTGLISIDWDAINKITDKDTGAAIEEYIGRLEEISGQIEDAQDTIEDMNDQVEEIRKRGIDEYLELEERVYQALVDQQQKTIDDYQTLSDTINDSNTKVIDNLREQIDLERQIRDNTKTEEEIADKEVRLAYLQRDTSGANAMKILQLQDEIEQARENYQDSLIDQTIDQLAKDNDLAAEQRAQQIEIMQAQLDYATENGEFWEETYALIHNAFDENGNLNNNSELVTLLSESEAFRGLSYFGKQNWIEEMAVTWKQAQEGLSNLRMREAREKGSLTLDNGTKLTYDTESNKWTDSKNNTYKDVIWDEQKGQYIGISNNDAKVSTTPDAGSGQSQSSSPYGKVSEVSGNLQIGSKGTAVKALQDALNKLGFGNSGTNGCDGIFGQNTAIAVKSFQKAMGISTDGIVGRDTKSKFKLKGYQTGGLADFTGPAWLDGTKSHPELVLDATDSQNFIALKNILAQLLNGQSVGTIVSGGGDNYFDIDISAELGSDYDVDQLADRIKKQIYDNGTYRNVNTMNYLR